MEIEDFICHEEIEKKAMQTNAPKRPSELFPFLAKAKVAY